jgi:DNA-binding transcriptional ArsR family regulator
MYSSILARTDALAAARFFRVLGDPTRLRILQLLEEGERTVNELVTEVDGLDGIMDRAVSAMSPVAQRLATCTRIGPDWV